MADIVRPGEPAGGPLNSGALPANQDLALYKGDYAELVVTVKQENGVAVNLTGYTAQAQLKTSYGDTSPINLTCDIFDAPAGKVRISLSTATSATLVPGSYIWDFQLTNPSGQVRTYLAGDVTVYNEVTA